MIQISLQLGDALIQVLAERDLIKLLQDGLVKAFANAVCLRMIDFSFAVINVVDGKEELIVMGIGPPAKLGAAVGQYAQTGKFMFIIKRQHLIIE